MCQTRPRKHTKRWCTCGDMCSHTFPFLQCIHTEVQIAIVHLFTGPDRHLQTSKTHTSKMADNAGLTELVRSVLDNLASNCHEKLAKAKHFLGEAVEASRRLLRSEPQRCASKDSSTTCQNTYQLLTCMVCKAQTCHGARLLSVSVLSVATTPRFACLMLWQL